MLSVFVLAILLKKNIIADTMLLPVNRGNIVELEKSARTRPSGIFISPSDDFNIRSCTGGRVQSVWPMGHDWNVMISRNDTFYTYAQMDTFLVNPGELINPGDLIGERKKIPGDYNSIIFIVTAADRELDPRKFIRYK